MNHVLLHKPGGTSSINFITLRAESPQSCTTLCDPMDYKLPGSSVHGISQPRMLELVAIPPPGDLFHPGIYQTCISVASELAGRFFTTGPPGKPKNLEWKVQNETFCPHHKSQQFSTTILNKYYQWQSMSLISESISLISFSKNRQSKHSCNFSILHWWYISEQYICLE